MIERPFTVAPFSEAESAVGALLHALREDVVSYLAPDALLLSGSFGRGEGGAFMADDAVRTVSDIDLIAVYRGPTSVVRTILARRSAANLVSRWRRTFPGAQIDLTVRPALLLTWPPATLDYFDLLRSARVLYGAVRLPPAAAVRLADIPPEERRRLLVKRGIGLLHAWLQLKNGALLETDAELRDVESDIDKAFLACGDTWLHRYARFDHRLLARIELMRDRQGLRELSDRLRFEYETAGLRRLMPSSSVPRTPDLFLARWRGAAQEWLLATELLTRWARRGDTPREIHPWRHPARSVRHAIVTLRRLRRGLPSVARQREALPLLLRLALGDDEREWLHRRAGALLAMPRSASYDLAMLVRRFLHATTGTDQRAPQQGSPSRDWPEPLPHLAERPA